MYGFQCFQASVCVSSADGVWFSPLGNLNPTMHWEWRQMRKRQQQQWGTNHSLNTEKKKVLSLSLVFQWSLLCYPSKWMGSRAWVNSQLMIIKTHTCITDTVKPINTDHKGKWGQSVGSPSIPFCFWAEKSKHKRLEILASQNVLFPTTKPTVSSLLGL